MIKKVNRNEARLRRHARVRKNISGTQETPRLNVFKSNKAVYVQLINDAEGITIASASTKELNLNTNNVEACKQVGELIAKKAKDAGVETVVFDRGGYKYHGKIAAIADSARENGLKF